MDWLGSLVDRRIREAQERGEFDNLPGAGKPLDLSDADDPEWWIKRYTRRERIDPSALMPPTLALRREADGFPDSLADLTSEDQVRAVLADFNSRVVEDWRRAAAGRGLPVVAHQVDVEAMVAAWRRRRAEVAASGPTMGSSVPTAADVADPGEAGGRSLLRRLFRRSAASRRRQ